MEMGKIKNERANLRLQGSKKYSTNYQPFSQFCD